MKNNYQFKNRFLSTIFFFIILFGFVKCSDENFPYHEFKDNTESFKGKTLTTEVKYDHDTKFLDLERLTLREILNKSENGISFEGTIFYYKEGLWSTQIESTEVIFFIPKDIENTVPNLSYGDPVMIEFICEEGKINSGNRVISISRKD